MKEAAKTHFLRPAPAPTLHLAGAPVWAGLLTAAMREDLLGQIRDVVRLAPFVQPHTPSGKPMSVRMTSAGSVGWVSRPGGYAYAARHPDGMPWPPIPPLLAALWAWLLPDARPADTCLVNLYRGPARMGLHQDRDEADLSQPVLSVSLGDDALFRIGGSTRGGPTQSLWLGSGDVLALSGPARMAYHGIDRVRPGSSGLLEGGGRLNLTLRVAL